MNKLKYLHLRKEDGTYDTGIPLSADAQNIIMQNNDNLQDTIDTINSKIENLNTKKLTNRIKQALLSCFEHVTWTNENGQEYYNELNDALYGITHLTFKSYDGQTIIDTVTCIDGVPQAFIPEVPSRPDSSDGQYSYTPIGWNTELNSQTADPTCVTNVLANRVVYATYTAEVKTYTATFVRTATDGGGTLQTIQDIPYGTSITAANAYTGSTPTSTRGSATDYPFNSWAPASAIVQGNVIFTAKFDSPVEIAEITDDWDTIIANIDNGTYGTQYKIGNYKPLDLGTEGIINMQIVAMDADELASGGTAPLTFVGMELLATKKSMERTRAKAGGWESSDIRTYLISTILPLIVTANSNVATRLQYVNKIQGIYNYESGTYIKNSQTIDKLWVPSLYEISGETAGESTGVRYFLVYPNEASRIKARNSSNEMWWTRTTSNYMQHCTFTISSTGKSNPAKYDDDDRAICFGFCLGLEAETITDDWSTILANQNYATDYSIGDTKMLDLGTEGKHLMEIVAFDTDDRADGNGKAGITWISRTLLNSTHAMNATQKTVDGETAYTAGGWENSDMRAYLKNTVKPLIPETVRNAIVPVTKVQSTYTGGAKVIDGQTTTDDVWIPGHREMFNDTSYESTGAVYSSKFNSSANRIKKRNASAGNWGLRSANDAVNFRYVNSRSYSDYDGAFNSTGVALGFCTN